MDDTITESQTLSLHLEAALTLDFTPCESNFPSLVKLL